MKSTVKSPNNVEETLRLTKLHLDEAQQIAGVGSFDSDILGESIWWSDHLYKLFGLSPESFTPTRTAFLELVHPDDLDAYKRSLELSLGTGVSLSINFRGRMSDGSYRVFNTLARATYDEQDAIDGLAGIVQDIEDRRRRELLLRESEEKYRTLVESSPYCIHQIGRDGKLLSMNQAGLQMIEKEDESYIVGMRYLDAVCEDDQARIAVLMERALAGEFVEFEFRGAMDLHFRSNFVPILNDDQQVDRLLGITLDISDHVESERRQKRLVAELDHRVKNTLAAILALVDFTVQQSDSLESFAETFSGRVRAMARTHEALASRRWAGVDIRHLVQLTFPELEALGTDRVIINGEDTQLPATFASPLCMALHELATNARKHGGLSTSSGVVEVRWELDDEVGLVLDWSEHDGPPIEDQPTPGLGVSLVKGLVEHELRGTVHLEFPVDGFHGQIVIPLTSSQGGKRAPKQKCVSQTGAAEAAR